MSVLSIRDQLHQQIDNLPDDIIQSIADFVGFVVSQRHKSVSYVDWEGDNQWQDFAMGHFLRESDDVEYTLDDAQEVYHP